MVRCRHPLRWWYYTPEPSCQNLHQVGEDYRLSLGCRYKLLRSATHKAGTNISKHLYQLQDRTSKLRAEVTLNSRDFVKLIRGCMSRCKGTGPVTSCLTDEFILGYEPVASRILSRIIHIETNAAMSEGELESSAKGCVEGDREPW